MPFLMGKGGSCELWFAPWWLDTNTHVKHAWVPGPNSLIVSKVLQEIFVEHGESTHDLKESVTCGKCFVRTRTYNRTPWLCGCTKCQRVENNTAICKPWANYTTKNPEIYMGPVLGPAAPPPPQWYGSKTYILATFWFIVFIGTIQGITRINTRVGLWIFKGIPMWTQNHFPMISPFSNHDTSFCSIVDALLVKVHPSKLKIVTDPRLNCSININLRLQYYIAAPPPPPYNGPRKVR